MKTKSLLITAVLVTAILCLGVSVKAQAAQAFARLITQLQQGIAYISAQHPTQTTTPNRVDPTITEVSAPGSGDIIPGRNFSITGTYFYPPDSVYVGNKLAIVTQDSSSTIIALAPSDLKSGPNYVFVTNKIGTSNRFNVTVAGSATSACTPKWTCIWGTCINGSQSQVITDSNDCGVASSKSITIACPALTQACNSSVKPFIAVFRPMGGETLQIGQTYRIKWTSQGIDSVYVYVYGYNGDTGISSWSYITPGRISVPVSQGYYDWTPTMQQLGSMINAHQTSYQIRVVDANINSGASPIQGFSGSMSGGDYFSIVVPGTTQP
jgi:hypothetical protein